MENTLWCKKQTFQFLMYSLLFSATKIGSKLMFWEKVKTEPDDGVEVIKEEEETEQTVQGEDWKGNWARSYS